MLAFFTARGGESPHPMHSGRLEPRGGLPLRRLGLGAVPPPQHGAAAEPAERLLRSQLKLRAGCASPAEGRARLFYSNIVVPVPARPGFGLYSYWPRARAPVCSYSSATRASRARATRSYSFARYLVFAPTRPLLVRYSPATRPLLVTAHAPSPSLRSAYVADWASYVASVVPCS